MLINKNTFYGIDQSEIDHLAKRMPPLWQKDINIPGHVCEVASMLIGNKVDNIDGKELDLPKYVMTKTTREICSKIKITGKTISLIQEISDYEDVLDSIHNKWRPCDIFGHISTDKCFYRYMIVAGRIYVVQCYTYKSAEEFYRQLTPADMAKIPPHELSKHAASATFVGYTVWMTPLGGQAEEYDIKEWQIEFFQYLMFLKYTQPDYKYVPAGKKIGSKKSGYTNATTNNVTVVDSAWNTTVIREEGFTVEGHLRLQACGEKHKRRKLIWIEPFKKDGYIRKGKGVNV